MAPKRVKAKNRLIDPDIASIVTAAGSIANCIVLAIQLGQMAGTIRGRKSRDRVANSFTQMHDEIGFLQHDLEIIADITEHAIFDTSRQFRLGRNAFMTNGEFTRWRNVSNDLMLRLKNLVALTNRIYASLGGWAFTPDISSHEKIDHLRAALEQMLRDSDQTIDQAIKRLRSIIQSISEMAQEINHN